MNMQQDLLSQQFASQLKKFLLRDGWMRIIVTLDKWASISSTYVYIMVIKGKIESSTQTISK